MTWWSVPALGTDARHELDDFVDPAFQWSALDAGEWIHLGDDLLAERDELLEESHGYVVYEISDEDGPFAADVVPTDTPLTLEFAGGPDIMAEVLYDAAQLPQPPQLTDLDVFLSLPIRAGEDLPIRWTPSGIPGDQVLVSIDGGLSGHQWHVDDAVGEVIIPQEIVAPFDPDFFDVSLARYRSVELQTCSGVVRVDTISRQYLLSAGVGSWSVEPDAIGPGFDGPLRLSAWDGPLDPATAFVELGEGITVSNIRTFDRDLRTLVADVVVAEDAPTGLLTPLFGDATISVTATDGLWVTADLEATGTCEDAREEDPVPDGGWSTTDDALPNLSFDTTTCAREPLGREQAIPVALAAGERLVARLESDTVTESFLYLADACSDLDPVDVCHMSGPYGGQAHIRYDAPTDEERMLVLDSSIELVTPVGLRLDLRREGPYPLVMSQHVVRTLVTAEITVTCTNPACDWTAPGATLDLGPDAVVALAVVDAATAVASVTLADAVPDSIDATYRNDAGVVLTTPDALAPRRFRYMSSCADADSFGAVTGGHWEGSTSNFDTLSGVEGDACFVYGNGSEAVWRIDIPAGQTLTAEVRMPGEDIGVYLVDDCSSDAYACADRQGVDVPEHLTHTALSTDTTVYLVIDGIRPGDWGTYDLDLEIRP